MGWGWSEASWGWLQPWDPLPVVRGALPRPRQVKGPPLALGDPGAAVGHRQLQPGVSTGLERSREL